MYPTLPSERTRRIADIILWLYFVHPVILLGSTILPSIGLTPYLPYSVITEKSTTTQSIYNDHMFSMKALEWSVEQKGTYSLRIVRFKIVWFSKQQKHSYVGFILRVGGFAFMSISVVSLVFLREPPYRNWCRKFYLWITTNSLAGLLNYYNCIWQFLMKWIIFCDINNT